MNSLDENYVDNRDLDQMLKYATARIDALRTALTAAEAENAALRLELADARAAMHDGLMTFLVGDAR